MAKDYYKSLGVDKSASKDEIKKALDEIQKLTDHAIKDVDHVALEKEKEILEI